MFLALMIIMVLSMTVGLLIGYLCYCNYINPNAIYGRFTKKDYVDYTKLYTPERSKNIECMIKLDESTEFRIKQLEDLVDYYGERIEALEEENNG